MRPGYGKAAIKANIAEMMRNGHPRGNAIRAALNYARCSYFARYPQGLLPAELAYPKNNRRAKDYMPNGAPIVDVKTRENPVRELDMSKAERATIQRNVQKQMTGQGAAVRKAAALYADFTGDSETQIIKVALPDMPQAALAIGQVDGIMYSTVRDGIAEKYIHKFKSKSRPLLTASPDGRQLYLIGGSYDFTERGIVDK